MICTPEDNRRDLEIGHIRLLVAVADPGHAVCKVRLDLTARGRYVERRVIAAPGREIPNGMQDSRQIAFRIIGAEGSAQFLDQGRL
jgi:hypothetical protein